MPPKVARKRPAADIWKASDRVRAALVTANQSMEQALALMHSMGDMTIPLTPVFRQLVAANASAFAANMSRTTVDYEMPTLPMDCWRIIMELAVGHRTLATFGPGGTVNEACDYYGSPFHGDYASLHSLRLVSRAWNATASTLVRGIVLDNKDSKKVRHPLSIAQTFPSVIRIKYKARACAGYKEYISTLVATLKVQWNKRYPGSTRTIVVQGTYHFLNDLAYTVRMQARNGNISRHAFVYRALGDGHTLNDADGWHINRWEQFFQLYENTARAGGLTQRCFVFVHDDNNIGGRLAAEAHKDAQNLDGRLIELHIGVDKGGRAASLGAIQEHGSFASVTFHTTTAAAPFLSHCKNVYVDLAKYDKLRSKHIVFPLLN